ncbi:hypothetical protein KL86PLE_90712 [uncultured Pleomorphomonas sp.]|uniref:Uncharacterized protein n=1 Tax=uncultured Pleomorphomonas sp. TaxID=442121 RepID=A0A212LQY9_9HYPH|nr:hypothetical protein [uncultured Pleomorphomonas sp.]SCM79927.1 hypothetical protein KL86PLE_90712 [uncultured Pleomorphomonas sp.]
MTIRLEIAVAYNCRPKKGESRHTDGRLLKTSIIFGESLDELLAEGRAGREAAEKFAPGYTEVISVRAYDKAAFHADPFGCPALFEAATL